MLGGIGLGTRGGNRQVHLRFDQVDLLGSAPGDFTLVDRTWSKRCEVLGPVAGPARCAAVAVSAPRPSFFLLSEDRKNHLPSPLISEIQFSIASHIGNTVVSAVNRASMPGRQATKKGLRGPFPLMRPKRPQNFSRAATFSRRKASGGAHAVAGPRATRLPSAGPAGAGCRSGHRFLRTSHSRPTRCDRATA